MTASRPRRITSSGSVTGGSALSNWPPVEAKLLLAPAAQGRRFGLWQVLTMVYRIGSYRKVIARCSGCGTDRVLYWDNLVAGKSLGCNSCSATREDTPQWLRYRLSCAKQRCTNPRHPQFACYGGRGIEFRFSSIAAAARWVVQTFSPLDRKLEIDRIDNDGHYEPSNLRLVPRLTNQRNRGQCRVPFDFIFVPGDWPYAKRTTMTLIYRGMTRQQILARARATILTKGRHYRKFAAWFASTT